ncbi:hypothetical protein Cabther_A1004 [Chloracidobacterium thermophilum B]|uniref:Uncharacterized protein n=1 Tax=Chloracidobacterium thermophilum (strain B) TaxID=981222 RepID=G2LFW6_CHLTF|nr:hypothetical protein Cabther_A1004 [Chloracidobacterium thermophilum B]
MEATQAAEALFVTCFAFLETKTK